MPSVLDEVFSFEQMKQRWDRDNPDNEYIRSKTVPSWYGLDQWIIRVNDEDKTISTTGWRESPTHILVGGTKSIPDSPRGHMTDLKAFRENKIPSNKPLLAAFTDADNWMQANINVGWFIKKYGIPEEVMALLPESATDQMDNEYGSKGNWGILPRGTTVIGKSEWWNIIKGTSERGR
jgi:hypothetical protein